MRTEAFAVNRNRLRHAYSIGKLYLTFVSQSGSYDIFSYISGHIRGRAVNFSRILARKRTASVPGAATVAVHNYLAACKARIPMGPAYYKAARRIDQYLCIFIQQTRRYNRLNNLFNYPFAQISHSYLAVMLGGYHH